MKRHPKASSGSTKRQRRGRFASLHLAGLLLALALAACLAPASALAVTAHEYESSFGPDCTASTHFETPGALVVDEAGHYIYVADAGNLGTPKEVFRCTTSGAPAPFTAGPGAGTNHIAGFSFDFAQGRNQIAVSPASHNFYVADAEAFTLKAFDEQGELANFTAGPAAGSNEFFGFIPCGVAVDANGDIYVAESIGGAQFTGAIKVLAPSGEEITSFETPRPCNLAVNSQGELYVDHEETKSVEKFTPSSFPVTPATTYSGALADPGPAYSIALDPSNGDLYVDQRPEVEHSRIAQLDAEGHPLGTFANPGETGELHKSEGIAVDGSTGNVYVSDNAGASRRVEIFVPAIPNPPDVGSSSVSGVTTTSANVRAQVNPRHFNTHYHFKYLTRAQYETNGETFAGAVETPEADLGSAGIPQNADAHLGALQPDTTYVFRVAAENENNAGSPVFGNVVLGEEGEFHTFPAFPPGLPDGRAYELVSPAAKGGEVFVPEPAGQMGASCLPPGPSIPECLPGQLSQMTPMQSAPDGESVAYLGNPFSAGLSSTANEYLAKRGQGGWATEGLSQSLFLNGLQSQGYKAFSEGLSRSVVYQIAPALSPEAPSSGGKSYANLYLRRSDGSLQPLVTAAPPHRPPGLHCSFNCEEFYTVLAGGNAGTSSSGAFTHLVFQANDALTGEVAGIAPAAPEVSSFQSDLYEWSGGQLRLVNVLPGNAGALAGAVVGSGRLLAIGEAETYDFDHAISDDGSRIFWSDASSGQVYVRIDGEKTEEIPDHAGKFLTASADGSRVLLNDGLLYNVDNLAAGPMDLTDGEGGFQGILGAGEDLNRIYFVDTKALTPEDEENANHEHAVEGKNNLYGWHNGATTFIGALVDNDNEVRLIYGGWRPASGNRLAQVSPDGNYLAFMSKARLTDYDNEFRGGGLCHLPLEGVNCAEVFEYDASADKLSCASCNPTGLRPLGPSNLSLIEGGGQFPAPTSLRQPGNLSANGDGRLFFESQDTLSPRDTNGRTTDIYEWEPNGVGSCKRVGGCIFLISSGNAANDSFFVDSSSSGKDAFFVTRQQLSLADKNDQLDLYDARVGGGLASETETSRSECQGEACQPAAVVPTDATPSSAAFSGAGNVKAKQHKKKHKRHAKKRHHKQVKANKHKRANSNRGGAK